jgi:DNA-binding NtrC family response regulator
MEQIQIGESASVNAKSRKRPRVAVRRSIDSLSSLAAVLTEAVEALETSVPPLNEGGLDFYEEVRRFEIALITSALRHTGGSQVKAAGLLKLRTTTLNSKIKGYGIS